MAPRRVTGGFRKWMYPSRGWPQRTAFHCAAAADKEAQMRNCEEFVKRTKPTCRTSAFRAFRCADFDKDGCPWTAVLYANEVALAPIFECHSRACRSQHLPQQQQPPEPRVQQTLRWQSIQGRQHWQSRYPPGHFQPRPGQQPWHTSRRQPQPQQQQAHQGRHFQDRWQQREEQRQPRKGQPRCSQERDSDQLQVLLTDLAQPAGPRGCMSPIHPDAHHPPRQALPPWRSDPSASRDDDETYAPARQPTPHEEEHYADPDSISDSDSDSDSDSRAPKRQRVASQHPPCSQHGTSADPILLFDASPGPADVGNAGIEPPSEAALAHVPARAGRPVGTDSQPGTSEDPIFLFEQDEEE